MPGFGFCGVWVETPDRDMPARRPDETHDQFVDRALRQYAAKRAGRSLRDRMTRKPPGKTLRDRITPVNT